MISNELIWSALLCAVLTLFSNALAESPARAALKLFQHGANFGNYLEVPPDQTWAVHFDTNDLDHVRAEGFDHVRLPVGWHHYAGPAPEFRLQPEIFGKVDNIVTNALARGLSILINIHHFDEFTSDPAANTNKFYAIWRQIAEHYGSQPNGLAFELINEPKDAATTEILNPIYSETIRVIRCSNPHRTIFLGPSKWDSLDEVPKLKLPDDNNVIVTVHCYDPFYFTHQGASWAGPDPSTRGVIFPGPPSVPLSPSARAAKKEYMKKWFERYNTLPTEENPSSAKAFTARMEKVAQWSREHNTPIYLGEFGAYTNADEGSRVHYYSEMRKMAERLGFGWAIWDWKAGFNYWDTKRNEPMPGMNEALFAR